ncbi:MAG TPA: HEAT repeat domain-containing protein [Planctomycetota bacterium]|nr:HEAT repeat domain-containing protein [Planctomycetota bacterium]
MRTRCPFPLLLAALLALAACAKSTADWRADMASEDPYARLLAVVGLGRSGDPEAVDDLCAAVSDGDEEVAREAREALARFAPVAVPRLLDGLADRQARGERDRSVAAALLIGMGAPAVPLMAAALRDGTHARAPIALTLGRMGEPGVLALAALLREPDAELAALAARSLAGSGEAGRAALPALAEALARPEPEVVKQAAAARAALRAD